MRCIYDPSTTLGQGQRRVGVQNFFVVDRGHVDGECATRAAALPVIDVEVEVVTGRVGTVVDVNKPIVVDIILSKADNPDARRRC